MPGILRRQNRTRIQMIDKVLNEFQGTDRNSITKGRDGNEEGSYNVSFSFEQQRTVLYSLP